MATYNEVVLSPSSPPHEGLRVLLQELSLNMRRGLVLNATRERGEEGSKGEGETGGGGGKRERERERERVRERERERERERD